MSHSTLDVCMYRFTTSGQWHQNVFPFFRLSRESGIANSTTLGWYGVRSSKHTAAVRQGDRTRSGSGWHLDMHSNGVGENSVLRVKQRADTCMGTCKCESATCSHVWITCRYNITPEKRTGMHSMRFLCAWQLICTGHSTITCMCIFLPTPVFTPDLHPNVAYLLTPTCEN